MRVLVTGVDGFAGRHVARSLVAAGHTGVGTTRPDGAGRAGSAAAGIQEVPLELRDPISVRALPEEAFDAVIHLAAVASGGDALRDPGLAWEINAAGTARLVAELGRRRCAGGADPVVLVVSTGEVYGALPRAACEGDPPRPRSPYAASKLGGELAAWETAARTGLRVMVARTFPHTGPGQDTRFVLPALAERLVAARTAGARVVKVGNLEPVRDVLDVRDAAAAYLALLARGVPGETYNVASGTGVALSDLFRRLGAIIGVEPIAEVDAALMRPADLPVLIGDPTKLREATGWRPAIALDQTLRDMVDAQAH